MNENPTQELRSEIQELRARLAEAQETLDAIRRGEVDGLVISTPKGEQVYTISGAETPYRVLIEEMREGAVMLSEDNTILYCNRGFAKMVKRPLEDIVGINIEGMVSPNYQNTFKKLLTFARASRGTRTKEITFQSKDKTSVATQISINSLQMEKANTVFLVITDLTEHMDEEVKRYTTELEQAQLALAESEQRWATTLASIGDAVIATDLSGNITFLNNAAEVLSGWTLVEASQKPVEEVFNIINGKTLQRVENPVAKVLKEGTTAGLANNTILVRKDKTEIPIADSGAPIKDKDGKITGVVLIFRDISERKKMEEKVSQSMQTFLELVERAPFGIYIVDSQFHIAHMNKGSQNGAFRNVRPVIGRDFNEAMHILWPEPTASEIISHFRHTLETGEPYYSPQFISLRHDVEIVEAYEWELQRMRLPDGKYGVICYYFDSTKLRKAEKSLSEAQAKLKEYATSLEKLVEERTKQLRASERLAAIGATAGMVGHDIRNPLQSIISELYLAKTELPSIPESDVKNNILESLANIENDINYINKIVQDLQDFTRTIKFVAKVIDLQTVCEEVLLKIDIPNNVEATCKIETAARVITSDPDALKRVLENLVTNAVQAMPDGGQLTIKGYEEAESIVVSVKDTGVGIPDSVKDKLFTPLFTTKAKGQGFGLAVVKRITEALGGTISFESQIGKGTAFFVRLPSKTKYQ